MMYPWNNINSSRRQQQQQQRQQQRAPGSSPIRTSSGYTMDQQKSPARIPLDDTTSTSFGECLSINSHNPNDGMMDSVFKCHEDTVPREGGYLYGGSSDNDEENMEANSNRRDSYADRDEQGFAINSNSYVDRDEQGFAVNSNGRDTYADTDEQGFQLQSMKWKSRSGRLSSIKSDISMMTETVVDTPETVIDNTVSNTTIDDNDIRIKQLAPVFSDTLVAEFCKPRQDWYSVRDTVTGRRLDFAASFAPKPTFGVLTVKLSSTLIVVGTMAFSIWVFSLQQHDDNNSQQPLCFWLSYFTNWSLIMAAVYQLLSLSNTLCSTPGMACAPPTEHVTGRIKWTWIFFTIALHSQVLAALLFWIAWFEPSHYKELPAESFGFYYVTIVPHSITFLAVAMDGLMANRIPLRLMHWWGWILGFNLLYIAWTVVRSLVLNNNDIYVTTNTSPLTEEYGYNDMNNGTSSTNYNLDNYTMDSYGSATGSTALYNGGVLNWQDNWLLALIQSLIICFAISPAIYILLWMLSLYSWPPCCCANDRRRYVK